MPSRPGTRSGPKAGAQKTAPPPPGSAAPRGSGATADSGAAADDGADSSIRVVLRVRPPIKQELSGVRCKHLRAGQSLGQLIGQHPSCVRPLLGMRCRGRGPATHCRLPMLGCRY